MNGHSQYWRSLIRKTTMSLFVALVMSVCQAYAQPNPVDTYIAEKMKEYRILDLQYWFCKTRTLSRSQITESQTLNSVYR